jgi:[acyl-carrier-protein] S-malonyltransferase
MTQPWIDAFPHTAKPFLEETDSILRFPLSALIASGPSSALTATPNAQPAIMATSMLILRILMENFNFNPSSVADVVLGHSLGEFSALVSGGYLSYESSLRLVRRRAEAMAASTAAAVSSSPPGTEYGMVALVCEAEHLDALISAIYSFLAHGSDTEGSRADSADDRPQIEQVLIANINSKNQIVLSGEIGRIRELLAHLRQFAGHDPRAVRLNADSPFHSPLMRPAQQLMSTLLDEAENEHGDSIVHWPGSLPCISNVTARPFGSREELKRLFAEQCVATVRWWDSIKYLDQEEKVRRWIGIGPGKVGRNLVGKEVGMRGRDAIKGGGVWGIQDPREVEAIMRALEETQDVPDEE